MRSLLFCAAAVLTATTSWAAPAVDTVRVDLNPLIERAARTPSQFAVNVVHSASTAREGVWSRQGTKSTWTYTVRVPTAISMSFHAANVRLPSSALLTVTAGSRSVRYTSRDVGRIGIWGRPLPGDTLAFSLTVNTAQADQVRVQIQSLQAGYRSLGGGVPDHPHFRELQRASAAVAAGCTENFECHASAANQGPSHATVVVLVEGLFQCTGTLVTDTAGDGIPYIVTARHCQTGQLGGGNPDVAADVSVYWDVVSACDTQLGSIYSVATPSQTGGTTVLEQQDLWVIQLDTAPASNDAYYAGWDASGATFSGGYTIHHALGLNQQYVQWSGTDILEKIPATTLNIAYDSVYWGVVNGLGNVGAGASGSALFSPNNLVVGSASLAALTNGENSAGVCPVSPPPTPRPDTVTALFTSLSGVWTSTADRTSSTTSKTLKSLLDPNSTGALTAPGLATQPITLTASASGANTGDLVTLSWSAVGAQSCTAWGGSSGDGWAGPQPASGSVALTNETGGTVIYSLNCAIGRQIGAGSISVNWDYIAPQTDLTGGYAAPLQLGYGVGLNWSANVTPCTASGGIPGDGWAGAQPDSGSLELTVTQPGITAYTLTCGSGGRTATDTVYVYAVAAPQTWLFASVSNTIVNSYFDLSWQSNAIGTPCVLSGGSSTDGWAGQTGYGTQGSRSIRESVPGTYTYTVTCTFGGQTSSSSQTVIVTSGAPSFSVMPAASQQQVGAGPNPNLYWTSNVGTCFITYGSTGIELGDTLTGTADVFASQPGPVTYTLECGQQSTTTTIDWVTTPIPNALSTTDTSWAANVQYPLSWSSGVGPCTASGGATGDGWAGAKSQSGTQLVSEPRAGGYLFTLTCGSGASATTSNLLVQVPSPIIQIYSTPAQISGTTLTTAAIQWQSGIGPCTYYDGSSPGGAGVSVPARGQANPTPTASGTFLFTVTCGVGTNTITASTLAYVPVPTPTSIKASASQVEVDAPLTVTWNSAGGICYALGGTGTGPWSGTLGGAGSGSLVVTSPYAGAVTYAVNCNGESASVTVTYVAVPATSTNTGTPTASLSASASDQVVDESFTLTWSSKNTDSCVASGGNQGDDWSGTLASSGSMTVKEATAGTVTYSITCSGAPPAASASTAVDVKSQVVVATQPPSSGGGGGFDALFTMLLTLVLALRGVTASRRRGAPLDC